MVDFRSFAEGTLNGGHLACVGLDSAYERIPECIRNGRSPGDAVIVFNREIVAATHDLVDGFKPNLAFYFALYTLGINGAEVLKKTVENIRDINPRVPIVLDAKYGDIGNTNEGYAKFAFDYLGVDAVTVHPYLGKEALGPFLTRKDKGAIVLCRTSNHGAPEFQDLLIPGNEPLYRRVARNVAEQWNTHGNCALVVGATYPDELAEVRKIVGDMPILVPGIGEQGGDLPKTVIAGLNSRNQGMMINSSRGIIFASDGTDFAEAARRATQVLCDGVNACR